jgi:hypothetical protein
VPRRSLTSAAVAAAALALSAGVAGAVPQRPEPDERSRDLWATVNVCDTPAHPDTMGIRASMPGTGRAKHDMFMRFTIQYRAADRRWRRVSRRGTSDFIYVGSGAARARQGGWTVRFARSTPRPQLLRGVVSFYWRGRGKIFRRTRVVTEGDHPTTAGADPRGFSAATCRLR